MKIVCASDSFKGSLTSEEICEYVKQEAKNIWENVEYTGIPMADGGEGTLHAILQGYLAATAPSTKTQFIETAHKISSTSEVTSVSQLIPLTVRDPLGREISCEYGLLKSENGLTAIIELAKASGLTLLSDAERNPLFTSTYGTGQLILDAVKRGARKIIIGIGGSATNDGGTGAMEALGARFYDSHQQLLSGKGENLEHICKIEWDDSLYHDVEFTIMCDVKNPLTGPTGATMIFGTQKGATKETLLQLERGMKHYEALLTDFFSENIAALPGGGAAGGIGAALSLFLHAKMTSGASEILKLYHFNELIKNTDLVITGEGSLDLQTANGKVVSVVADYCSKKNIPCLAVVGSLDASVTSDKIPGLTEILCIKPESYSIEESIQNAPSLYRKAIHNLFSDLKKIQSFLHPESH